MGSCFTHILPLPLLLPLLLLASVLISASKAQTKTLLNQKGFNVSAIFVFGDSTVDPGNNNYLGTPFKSNFPPYGRDFANQIPTGRFTNGRLPTDFIASYLGIKEYVPPYLDRTLSLEELMTGVSFASAGSGYDPLTPQLSRVIQITKQVEYFKEYKTRLEREIGKKRTESHIKKALHVVSAGTNDFVVNYFGLPIQRQIYSVANYQQFLMQNIHQVLQGLWDLGARKIAVVGLPPIGCLPIVITLNSHNAFLERGCIDSLSSVAREYNQMLQNELAAMQKRFTNVGGRIFYIDIYKPLVDMIQDHNRFGFEEWMSGCCGTGLIEASFLCNLKSLVCPDASKYVFWDSIHPTEKTYYMIVNNLRPIIDAILKNP